ncbi:MAG: response regulator transcription factor [Candidatus Latescibacteria bacterium]|nr:response regulator transcription factor [Candidatus Latescibacterota bacterium]
MRKIVLVDDDPDIQESIKMVLENAGYEFRGATDRKSGMELIKRENPDLMIIDVMMEQPDDGFFMVQELRSRGVKTPIIMLTSVSSVTGMKYGKDDEMVSVDDYEEKPIAPDKLLDKIESLLENGGNN